jgi:hypothetical protein
MSELSLVKTRIRGGVWEGVLTGPARAEPPRIEVSHLGAPLAEAVTLTADPDRPGAWTVCVAIPSGLLADGVQSFLITEAESGARLGGFSIVAGEPMDDDLRAEVELLRAELDLLKRAFRRHCVETR